MGPVTACHTVTQRVRGVVCGYRRTGRLLPRLIHAKQFKGSKGIIKRIGRARRALVFRTRDRSAADRPTSPVRCTLSSGGGAFWLPHPSNAPPTYCHADCQLHASKSAAGGHVTPGERQAQQADALHARVGWGAGRGRPDCRVRDGGASTPRARRDHPRPKDSFAGGAAPVQRRAGANTSAEAEGRQAA